MPEPHQVRLLVARLEAIAAGDKALGREIYHQLFNTGMAPHEIDAWQPAEAPVAASEPSEPEPAADSPVETADAPAAPEQAVKRGPGRPRKA